jgi:hypothetical protein
MARKPNRLLTVTITLSTTHGVESYLKELVAGGLFGKNTAEAAERLVARGIEALLRDGRLRERSQSRGSRRV